MPKHPTKTAFCKLKEEKDELVSDTIELNEIIENLEKEVLYHVKQRRSDNELLVLQRKALNLDLLENLQSENADLKRKYEKLSHESDLTKIANEIGDFDNDTQDLGDFTYRVVKNETYGFADRDLVIWKGRNRNFNPDAWYKITTNQLKKKYRQNKIELLSVDCSKQYPNGLYYVVNPKNKEDLIDTILLSVNFKGIKIEHLVEHDDDEML